MATETTSGATAPTPQNTDATATALGGASEAPMKTDPKAVFKAKVNERLSLHPNAWTGEDSAEVVRAVVTTLQDSSGKPVELTEFEKEVIQLASRPTNRVQLSVIKRILDAHGAKMDADTENRIKQVVSPTAFKIELTKAGRIKDTSSGGLKDLLD